MGFSIVTHGGKTLALVGNLERLLERIHALMPGMGKWASAKRSEIKPAFEGTSGDMNGDIEPAFLTDRVTGKDVARAEVRSNGGTLEVIYQLLSDSLDDADFERIFHIAYLDVFTGHYWCGNQGGRYSRLELAFCNRDSGYSRQIYYPDPE